MKETSQVQESTAKWHSVCVCVCVSEPARPCVHTCVPVCLCVPERVQCVCEVKNVLWGDQTADKQATLQLRQRVESSQVRSVQWIATLE